MRSRPRLCSPSDRSHCVNIERIARDKAEDVRCTRRCTATVKMSNVAVAYVRRARERRAARRSPSKKLKNKSICDCYRLFDVRWLGFFHSNRVEQIFAAPHRTQKRKQPSAALLDQLFDFECPKNSSKSGRNCALHPFRSPALASVAHKSDYFVRERPHGTCSHFFPFLSAERADEDNVSGRPIHTQSDGEIFIFIAFRFAINIMIIFSLFV